MAVKIGIAFALGAVVGGLAGISFWRSMAPKPEPVVLPPHIELKPATQGVIPGADGKPPEHAYFFEVSGLQCYTDSNGRLSVVPAKEKAPGVSFHNKGNGELDVSVTGKPRSVITVHAMEGRIMSFSLENGSPGNRLTQFDLFADGVYDFVDLEEGGQKTSQVLVSGRWFPYTTKDGRHFAEVNGQLREVLTGEAGVFFKPQEESSLGAEIP